MSRTVHWTTPADLRRQVRRLWDRGAVLAGLVTGEALFPRRLVLKPPTSAELGERFDEARSWSASLRSMPHVRFTMREFRHRILGLNTLPHQAWIDTAEDALAMLGKGPEAAQFRQVVESTKRRQPALLTWLERKPLRALAMAGDWERLLDVVGWLQDHPRPGVHLRQVDVAGVHTKFVEAHRGTLGELLDVAMPPECIDRSATGVAGFARRYGFLDKPERIRFRILDRKHSLLPVGDNQDVTLDADSFAALGTGVSTVFVTENEINFLAFPPVDDGMVIFGSGYGFETLGRVRWLARCRLCYWGDIDTHGFAILDELRRHFRHARSFLMDRDTFLAFRPLWVTEAARADRELSRLTADERALYDDLRYDRLGPALRLEQERIGFGWVKEALAKLEPRASPLA